jgi:hypothetical protein
LQRGGGTAAFFRTPPLFLAVLAARIHLRCLEPGAGLTESHRNWPIRGPEQ